MEFVGTKHSWHSHPARLKSMIWIHRIHEKCGQVFGPGFRARFWARKGFQPQLLEPCPRPKTGPESGPLLGVTFLMQPALHRWRYEVMCNLMDDCNLDLLL